MFVLALLFAVGHAVAERPGARAPGPRCTRATGLVGTGVSGAFLYLIAALNAMILWGVVKVFLEMRAGRYDEDRARAELASRGLMNRFFGRFTAP